MTQRVAVAALGGLDEAPTLAAALPAASDTRLRHWRKGAAEQNFGDYLSEFLFTTVATHPRVEADVFHLVGSVIAPSFIETDLKSTVGGAQGWVAFWCCGARSAAPLPAPLLDRCLFFGVRGPRTREALGLPRDTVLGDPGLLLPLLHAPAISPVTVGKTLCMPHIFDQRPEAELLAMSGADIIVRPQIEGSEAALRDIVDQIASASFVLTASLHGAVIAAAYRTPFAFWDNGELDVPFKWEDFSASIEIDCAFARSVAEGAALYGERTSRQIRLPRLAPILAVCPYAPRPALLVRALAYDGNLPRQVAAEAAAALDQIAATADDAALARHAERYRAARASLGGALRRTSGLKLHAAKQRLSALVKGLKR